MIVLGMDSCTPMGAVGLVRDGRLSAEVSLNVEATHSERLMLSVSSALELAGLRMSDLSAVGVAVGPGSFTGIRIGVSAAKGISYALGLPCVGVVSLEALAHAHARVRPGSAPAQAWVCPMILARRAEVFWALYRCGTMDEVLGGRPLTLVDGPALSRLDEVVRRIEEARSVPPNSSAGRALQAVAAVGDGSLHHRQALSDALGGRVEFPHEALALGRGAAVADLARLKLQAGESADAFSLRPFYLRSAEAEVKWQLSRTSREAGQRKGSAGRGPGG